MLGLEENKVKILSAQAARIQQNTKVDGKACMQILHEALKRHLHYYDSRIVDRTTIHPGSPPIVIAGATYKPMSCIHNKALQP